MNILKSRLDALTYDKLRTALGLEPLQEAAEKGQKITDSVRNNILKQM